MSLTVVVQETALRTLARIRAEDKEAFASIGRALAALAEQPHPDQAVAWGGSGIYRLRLPHWGTPPDGRRVAGHVARAQSAVTHV